MVGKHMKPLERVEHWNRHALDVRLRALHAEITKHLKDNLAHLQRIASQLRALGVKFTSDMPTAAAGTQTSEKEEGTFLSPWMTLQQVPHAKLQMMILACDPKYLSPGVPPEFPAEVLSEVPVPVPVDQPQEPPLLPVPIPAPLPPASREPRQLSCDLCGAVENMADACPGCGLYFCSDCKQRGGDCMCLYTVTGTSSESWQ